MVSLPTTQKAGEHAQRILIIALVWAPEENRTATYAKLLNAPLFNVHYLLYKRPFIAPVKYIAQALKTWWVLMQQRPRFVYITNPPVFAPLCVFLYGKFTGTQYIMDTHSPSLYSRRWGWTLPLQRFLAQRAFINVVDQKRFKDLFDSWSASAIVLEKPPRQVHLNNLQRTDDPAEFSITVINTFAVDEPVDIILEAARWLPHIHFYILGDKRLADADDLKNAPSNVTFTGYLLGDDYWNRLYCSRGVMALTNYAYSLLAGAQDGAAVNRPLILSRQPALEEYFPKGAIFIDNTATGIVAGIEALFANEQRLSTEIREIVEVQNQSWEKNFQYLKQLIGMGTS